MKEQLRSKILTYIHTYIHIYSYILGTGLLSLQRVPAHNIPAFQIVMMGNCKRLLCQQKMLEQAARIKGSKSSTLKCERNCREIFKILEKTPLFNRFSPLPLIQGYSIKMVDYKYRI